MTFTEKQQKEHRSEFIRDCHQKAWNAACHADWMVKQLDDVLAAYTKLKGEDQTLEEEIKALEAALDSHTKDNRDKRKACNERRVSLSKQMQAILQNHEQGQRALANLYQSIESNLELAKHAERWEWKEAEAEDSPAKI